MDSVSKRLTEIIDLRGISYGELARITGIPKSALHRYAKGETKKISIDKLQVIAKALHVSPAYLMMLTDKPNGSAGEYEGKDSEQKYDYASHGISARTNGNSTEWQKQLDELEERTHGRTTLTDHDLDAIAQRVASVQTSAAAPKTVEARIVSFGIDQLPQEERERLLNMFRAMYSNHPELFEMKKGENK